ncbi:proteasome subunit beta, partial [bacterium]
LKANAQMYRYERGKPMPVSAAARLVGNVLFSARVAPLILQALIGGIDESGGRIYALDPLGSITEEKCVSTGSGSPIAYGVLESQFKEGMTVKDTVPIVIRAIDSAMKRDAGSGDSFDVALVTSKGYRELTEEEKKTLLANKA